MTIRKLGEVSSDFVALGKSREKYSNHEQFKDATTGGFLMTEKNNFDSIAE